MLLIPSSLVSERRRITSGTLAPLADSLAHDLAPFAERGIHLPADKALLSRAGGRCERDGATLAFDPWSPTEHRCPDCGLVHRGELHDRWWIYPYQLWLAERAVHAALLGLLRDDATHGLLAHDILTRYADAYLTYPNRDNVLGPSRLFFSTYLESIWLLNVCIAADFLAAAGHDTTRDVIRDRIVEPASAIIAEYDEGLSNRQVWNNAALMAAARFCGDDRAVERLVHAPSGLVSHLAHGLLADGTWYEGENYHLFAHRGLWYGVLLAEGGGIQIPAPLLTRFHEAFAAPFATALPDLTLPSRKDSQYGVSLRQWRIAEHCELGLARVDDVRLTAALSQLYATDVPAGDTGRASASTDVERNVAPARLSRADLGWRSLLLARESLLLADAVAVARSAHLPSQGITVFRRDGGSVYVALDWGEYGGGHGHPDRLNLTFAQGGPNAPGGGTALTRWLDDLGTGSYVDPSLHWYRSTLAHNAPLFNGRSQQMASGSLVAYDERGGVGWVLARVDGVAPGVSAERAVVVTPDYFVDELSWGAGHDVRVELPVHFDADAPGSQFAPASLDGGEVASDGFAYLERTERARVSGPAVVALIGERDGRRARAWLSLPPGAVLYRAVAPGAPPPAQSGVQRFFVVRTSGASGTLRAVWAWSPRVTSVEFDHDSIHVAMGSERHEHRRTSDYWQVEMRAGAAKSGIELYGWARPAPVSAATTSLDHPDLPVPPAPPPQPHTSPPAPARVGARGVVFELGEPHYRRSEETWQHAGAPVARVTIASTGTALAFHIHARTGEMVFVPEGAENPYDNEHPDINGHGVQLYVATSLAVGGWVIVPVAGRDTARVRPIDGWNPPGLALPSPGATWHRVADGYTLDIALTLPPGAAPHVHADVLVNDTVPGRQRRRGQLVLSGAAGEFVYLRGDRHAPDRLIPLIVEP